MEPIFAGRRRVISGRLAARTDLEVRFGTNTKSLRGVICPISTPIDYLKTVFGDIVSLCRSCRNNALPGSHRKGKAQLFSLLMKSLSLHEFHIQLVS